MPDIFISYSRRDSEQAQLLTELLASAGLSVWIDQSGIAAATSWSGEISKAITDCKALIVLLSPSSVDSKNVTREVALAFERNKKILPIDIEPVILPDDFAYHLAGLQRSSMTNIDAIIRALGKLGLEATGAPQAPKIVKETDGKKSLMILPFEDLSPTGDNGWFADGIVSELIQSLSNIKSLRIADAQATKEFKSYKGQLSVYAREMEIRYFVQGDVRKFGDQIKINIRLLDIDTGDNLWQASIKGTMTDVFEIQEEVGQKVVDGLKLHLTSDEKKKLVERGTENAEAYELFLRAVEYSGRDTKEGLQLAVQFAAEAIQLDPNYAVAYQHKANSLSWMYRNYNRNPELLVEAEWLCKEALRLNPNLYVTYKPLSHVYRLQGRLEEAEQTAMEYIKKAPEDYLSHFTLGQFYNGTGQFARAIAPYEEAARLIPASANLFNLIINCHSAKELEKCKRWSLVGLPQCERRLKLHPDDERLRQHYSVMLLMSGRTEDARQQAMILKNSKDGAQLYNNACTFAALGDSQEAIRSFQLAIEAGYRNVSALESFLDDENDGIGSLKGTPEWESARELVEKIDQEEEAKKNA